MRTYKNEKYNVKNILGENWILNIQYLQFSWGRADFEKQIFREISTRKLSTIFLGTMSNAILTNEKVTLWIIIRI